MNPIESKRIEKLVSKDVNSLFFLNSWVVFNLFFLEKNDKIKEKLKMFLLKFIFYFIFSQFLIQKTESAYTKTTQPSRLGTSALSSDSYEKFSAFLKNYQQKVIL